MSGRAVPTVVAVAAGVAAAVASMAARQAPAATPPAPPLVKSDVTEKVSDHVWVIPDFNVGGVPNVGIVVGARATLVIDTGLGPRNAETILKEVAKVSRNTEMFLVATHYHPEHAGGSSAFPAGTKFVVSKAEQQDIDELGMGMMQRFSGMSPLHADLLRGVTFRKPEIMFDREYPIDLGGGVKTTLRSAGPTHTRGDTSIFVEPDGVLFAGDIALNHAFLAFSDQSSASAWANILGQLAALQPKIVVPSHGAVGTATVLEDDRRLLSYMMGFVEGGKGRGQTVEQITAALTTDAAMRYPGWTTPARIGAAVRVMFAEAK